MRAGIVTMLVVALTSAALVSPAHAADPRGDIRVDTFCDLDRETVGGPLEPSVGVRWVVAVDAEDTVIVGSTIGEPVTNDDIQAWVPGSGSHTFHQELTVEVAGEPYTLSYEVPVDCTGTPQSGRSESGLTEFDGSRLSCIQPLSNLALSYSWTIAPTGYSIVDYSHNLPGDVVVFDGTSSIHFLVSQADPNRFHSVDGWISVALQPDGGGSEIVEVYDISFDLTCLNHPITFVDDDNSPFEAEIEWLADQGITRGCDATGERFCPDDAVTRGQMAAFLVRALGYTDEGTVDFIDDDTSTFESDIEKLATAGITLGCDSTGTRFCPDELVSRGQMAAFLHRALDGQLTPGAPVVFSDDDGSVFEDDIEWLASVGVTLGCGNGQFCPADPVTRGQMAAFLYRALAD